MTHQSLPYDIAQAVGNTPLVKLKNIVPANSADIYVKLEYFNPTGSYKDRMALAIIEEAEKRGDLKPGMTVVECTGGSTGTSIAFVCAVKGYRFEVVSSDAFAAEKLKTIRLFGTDLELLASEGGKITPDLIPRMVKMAEEKSKLPGRYPAKQFENTDALVGYRQLGNEILSQLHTHIDVFCGAIGTGGMFRGVTEELKKVNDQTKIIALEPASAPLLSQGIKGTHKVEGIGVGFYPPLLEGYQFDEIRTVDEKEAREMARTLANTEGIFAGISTGLNVVAAIKLAAELGNGHSIVTVACDSGMKYLSGGLFD